MVRVLGSALCALLALALVAAGAWLRAGALVGAARALAELAARPRAGDSAVASRVEPGNDGKLVLMYGTPAIAAPPRVADGRVVAPDALVLESTVERYEQKDRDASASWTTTGGGERAYAQSTLGAYAVQPELLDRLQPSVPLRLDAATLAALAPKERLGASGVFYGAGSASSPRPGDLRVRYATAPNGELSILAVQRGAALTRDVHTYTASGIGIAFDVGVATRGRVGADAMYAIQRSRIHDATFGTRAFGATLVVLAGFFAAGALAAWRGPRRPAITHPAQLLTLLGLWVAWLFVAFALGAAETALGRALSGPVPLAVAIGGVALGLVGALLAAKLGVDRVNARWRRPSRRRR